MLISKTMDLDCEKGPLRVLLAKPGLDGHDRAGLVLAVALRNAGCEVIYTGLHAEVEAIARIATDEDVQVVGLSIHSGAHLPLCQQLAPLLQSAIPDLEAWVVGGPIPKRDEEALLALGINEVFPSSTSLHSVITWFTALGDRLGRPLRGAGASDNDRGSNTPGTEVKHSKDSAKAAEPVHESGLPIKIVYGPEDVEQSGGFGRVGNPGQYPFTRGIHPEMYRGRMFTMRQYAGFGTPQETNERFRFLFERGQNALNVAFDLPTQMGLDSDDPRAAGEVGRVGMAVDSVEDLDLAFDGIPLDEVSIALTINAPAPYLLAMMCELARRRGLDPAVLRLTLQNDMLKEYVGRGAWFLPVEPALNMVTDSIEYCVTQMPKASPVSVCGYHLRESGANPVQEIAWAFAFALTYIQQAQERGLVASEVARRLSFNFDIHGLLFEQIAKFRAARRLWARLLKERFACEDEKVMRLRMMAGGGGGGLTFLEPENNLIRSSYFALASALGGTQTMALCCFDEAFTIPSERATLLSLRTMQILAEETGVTQTVDPLAGSWYVETLTNQLEEAMVEELEALEGSEGVVSQVANGGLKAKLAYQAFAEAEAISSGERAQVGVNRHLHPDATQEPQVELHPWSGEIVSHQSAQLAERKTRRDDGSVEAALEELRQAANSGISVMPAMLAAAAAEVTVGEVYDVMRDCHGVRQERIPL